MNQKSQKKINNLENIERVPADKLFELIPIKKDDSVLDLGAGTGYISLSIADRVKRYSPSIMMKISLNTWTQ